MLFCVKFAYFGVILMREEIQKICFLKFLKLLNSNLSLNQKVNAPCYFQAVNHIQINFVKLQ